MLVKEFRSDFYDVCLKHDRVLVIASVDVDAVCAFKILQVLFRGDHVLYSLVTVATLGDLQSAIDEHAIQAKLVLLLNCGATINLTEFLSSSSDAIFFILDSRRPFDLDNVYDDDRIRLLIQADEEGDLRIPSYEDLHGEPDASSEAANEETENNDNEEDLFASPKPKKRRRCSSRVASENLEEQKHEILFDYYEFSYHSYSSAVLLYDLAWKLGRDSEELLWWASVGLANQFLERKINLAMYTVRCTELHQHLLRLNRLAQEQGSGRADRLKVFFEKDLLLSLYRTWSLYESLRHTAATACYFKTWTLNGECKLLTFLADLGSRCMLALIWCVCKSNAVLLPLAQCRQRYSAMDAKLRKEVHKAVESKLEKYGLNDLFYVSFSAQYSYSHRIAAGDAAEAVAAALNFSGKNLHTSFLTALDCLAKHRSTLLHDCVGQCRSFLKSLWADVKTILSTGQVVPHHSFLLAHLPKGTSNWCSYSKPYGLQTLGHGLQRAFCVQRNGQKHKNKPMIIMIPQSEQEDNDWYLVAGIAPHVSFTNEGKPLNCLGQAFRRVSSRVRCRIVHQYFDSFVILLKMDDRDRFCNALNSVLDV